jgi:FtsP/CotA-like multicopper oxidase with cupredoxin domain
MNSNLKYISWAVASCLCLATPSIANAVTVELKTGATTLQMPDGNEVTMWGFGLLTDANVSVPGPTIEVPPGDPELVIELTNYLPVPVSIVIPALPAALQPVWSDGSVGARSHLQQRATSFTHVAPAASGGQPGRATYQWGGVRPGTHLYHSGTHAAVQVQMGLYGAVRHDAAPGQAYPSVAYDRDVMLLYSEIDPVLHAAVASGTYGTAAHPSTVNYQPRYFLINGQPFTGGQNPAATAQVNERVLLRLLNAGLQTKIPSISQGTLQLVAEDGHAYPYARERYAAPLGAGQAREAIWVPAAEGRTVLYDRALNLTNGSATGGGAMTSLEAVLASGAPIAAEDSYSLQEDTTLSVGGPEEPAGVLGNDTGTGTLTAVLVSGPTSGTLLLSGDGRFTYQPNPDFAGVDSFTYRAFDGSAYSAPVSVWLTVQQVNDTPTANDDSYMAFIGSTLSIPAPGLLSNDTDPEHDMLMVEVASEATAGMLQVMSDGSFEYTPAPGSMMASFSYRVTDGSLVSDEATVTIMVMEPENAAPIAEDDWGSTTRNTAINLAVTSNDYDTDGSINAESVTIVDPPSRGGTATHLGGGVVRFTPRRNFTGTDTFTYVVSDSQGMPSAKATVRVNVVK